MKRNGKRAVENINPDTNGTQDDEGEEYTEAQKQKRPSKTKTSKRKQELQSLSIKSEGITSNLLDGQNFLDISDDYLDEPPNSSEVDRKLPSETGQIISITVQDFMCHRKLTVNFCRNVNFITGQNGSGMVSVNLLGFQSFNMLLNRKIRDSCRHSIVFRRFCTRHRTRFKYEKSYS